MDRGSGLSRDPFQGELVGGTEFPGPRTRGPGCRRYEVRRGRRFAPIPEAWARLEPNLLTIRSGRRVPSRPSRFPPHLSVCHLSVCHLSSTDRLTLM